VLNQQRGHFLISHTHSQAGANLAIYLDPADLCTLLTNAPSGFAYRRQFSQPGMFMEDKMANAALWSTTQQLKALHTGELTSRELLETYIARIDQLNPQINAVITRDFDTARKLADDADAARTRGDSRALLGVPITLKDALQTAGIRSTGGAVELKDNVPSVDAPVVQSVRDAGCVVMGKTNLPRWSGDVQAYNEMFGTTNNPWNLAKVPGGSSGGAAAAVAAGLTSFEIGTDIGGSIRFPSAFCGVFGHKPSFGIVPSTGYLDHANGGDTEADINVIGPITRSADDLELLLRLLVRKHVTLAPGKAPRGLRVAAWLDDATFTVDREVQVRLEETVNAIEKSGIAVDRTARPNIDLAEATEVGGALVGAATSWVRENSISHKQWLLLDQRRQHMRRQWENFFDQFDVILMPVAFVPPFDHQHRGQFENRTLTCNNTSQPYSKIIGWTVPVGMVYLPSTVPPVGLSSGGLPIGMQVVGAHGADLTTIRMAGHISALCGGYQPPPIAFSLD
jgi:amidase